MEKCAVLGRNNDRVVPKAEEFCPSAQTVEVCKNMLANMLNSVEKWCFGVLSKNQGKKVNKSGESCQLKCLHQHFGLSFASSYVSGENLQQDKAPTHKSAETSTCFLENGVDVLENWPPKSTDLNIIENLWSILKGRVAKRHSKTLEDLETFAFEEFYAIPNQYVEKLFKSIKNRLNLTKINQGTFHPILEASVFYLVS